MKALPHFLIALESPTLNGRSTGRLRVNLPQTENRPPGSVSNLNRPAALPKFKKRRLASFFHRGKEAALPPLASLFNNDQEGMGRHDFFENAEILMWNCLRLVKRDHGGLTLLASGDRTLEAGSVHASSAILTGIVAG